MQRACGIVQTRLPVRVLDIDIQIVLVGPSSACSLQQQSRAVPSRLPAASGVSSPAAHRGVESGDGDAVLADRVERGGLLVGALPGRGSRGREWQGGRGWSGGEVQQSAGRLRCRPVERDRRCVRPAPSCTAAVGRNSSC